MPPEKRLFLSRLGSARGRIGHSRRSIEPGGFESDSISLAPYSNRAHALFMLNVAQDIHEAVERYIYEFERADTLTFSAAEVLAALPGVAASEVEGEITDGSTDLDWSLV